MPPYRTNRVLQCRKTSHSDSLVTSHWSSLASHPYDIRLRPTLVLEIRAAKYAGHERESPLTSPKATPKSNLDDDDDDEKAHANEAEKTVVPILTAPVGRSLQSTLLYNGALQPLSHLAIFPEVPPLAFSWLCTNSLLLMI